MRRKSSIPGNFFELEALEPRVLLSADLLAAGVAKADHAKVEIAVDEVTVDAQVAAGFGEKKDVVGYDPAAQVDDIFADLEGDVSDAGGIVNASGDDASNQEAVDVCALGDNKDTAAAFDADASMTAGTVSERAADQEHRMDDGSGFAGGTMETIVGAADSRAVSDTIGAGTSASDAASSVVESVEFLTFDSVGSTSLTAATPAGFLLGGDVINPLSNQLTETLKAANGPPANESRESSVEEPSKANPASGADSQEGSIALGDRPVSVHAAAAEAAAGAVSAKNIHLTPEHVTDANGEMTIGLEESLTGTGTIVGNVVNRGLFSPGNSPGIVTIVGDSLFARSGTTVIQIGGTSPGPATVDFDQIKISGTATLGGTLQVQLINGFTPVVGQQFKILTYGSLVSNFDNYSGLALGGGLLLKPTFVQDPLDGSAGYLLLEVIQHSTTIDRPLLFVPGFAGSFFADDTPAGRTEWFLNRGLSPTKLVLEPLTNAYSNLVQSFINVGYTLGVDLFVANWDWRLPVAKQDLTADGNLTNVTGPEITDSVFETGVDYLGYWLDQAATTWNLLGNGSLPSVDLVTHSTGGLIARAYIESGAYGASYGGGKTLPKVFNFVESAAPNQGLAGTYLMLQDDFSQKASTRILGRTINAAYQAVVGGQVLHNPDGSMITSADLTAQGANAMKWFIAHYVESLQDLIGTYAMLDLGGAGTFVTPTTANGGFQNKLVQDLNGGADPNAFVDRVQGVTNVVYSAEVQTDDLLALKTGFQASLGLKNEILPFDRYLGDVPGPATTWYAEIDSNSSGPEGDGTVPTASAVGQFLGDAARLASGKLVLTSINRVDAGTAVGHSELTNNLFAQQKTIEAVTGTLPTVSQISTSLEISRTIAGAKLLQYGLLDPVALGQEVYDRIKPLIAGLKSSTRPDLETAINFIFNAVDSLNGGAGLSATVTTAAGAGKFGVVPAAGAENAYAYLALTQVSFLAGTAGKGVALTSGKMGLLIFTDGTYALDLSGAADIVGVTGLDFTGTISVQSNNSGTVDQSITVGAETVTVKFAQDTTFAFGGVLTLATPVADVSGKFVVEISGSEIFVGATEVTAFVGDKRGAGSTDDVGLKIADGRLALVIFSDQSYAFDAAGTATLVNVPDVTAAGTVSIKRNT
ncbi:MAG: LEPR-XLL domain-containing protein, partial [Chthoniobacteraceae bacterium]